MAALFQRTIRSKFTLRNSSPTSNSFSSFSEERLYVNKSAVFRRVSAEGVPAVHADRVTSFIKKTIEPALREKKYQRDRLGKMSCGILGLATILEYRYLLMRGCKPFATVTGYFALLTFVVAASPREIDKKDK